MSFTTTTSFLRNIFIVASFLFMSFTAFGQGSEDFDSPSWSSYRTGTVNFASGTWDMKEVFRGTGGEDRTGTAGCRINDNKSGAHLTTPALSGGVGVYSFYYKELNSGGGTFEILKSIDGGSTFTSVGTQSFSGTSWQAYSITVNEGAAGVMIRIENDNNDGHLIIDEVSWTGYASSAPEANVKQGTNDIADNSGTYSFGTNNIGTPSTQTFTIENTGTVALTLGTVTSSNTEFTVTQPLSSSVAAGGTTTFTVTHDPTANGSASATISFSNNDADENPYNFTVSGTGATPLPACTTPAAATSLVLTPVSTSRIDVSWTGSGADDYLLIWSTSATPPTVVDGSNYPGNATYHPIFNGAGTAFPATGLDPNTTYYFYVYANNNACNGAPFYASVLSSSATTDPLPTTVEFVGSSSTVTEGTASTTITVGISNPSSSTATSATVSLGSSNGRVNGFTSQVVTWAAGDNTDKTVTLTVTDNVACDGNEDLTFSLGSVSGGTSASAGTPSSHTLTVNDNDATNISVIENDFEAGNLTGWSSTGDWANSTNSAINGSRSLKHDLSNTSGSSYIYGDYPAGFDVADGDITWRLTIKNGGWDPSGSNYFWYVLMSDQLNFLASPSMDGYAVGVNLSGSSDLLTLYKITGGASNATAILTSTFNWNSNDEVAIEVTRNTAGEWELKYNDLGNFGTLTSVGTVTDATHTTATYHGVGFEYSSTRAGLLWIDDIDISQYGCSTPVPEMLTDTLGPLNFGNVTVSTTSAEQSYDLISVDLTDDVQINAPTDFAISLTSGGPYTSSLTLTPAQASATTIYVVYQPSSTGASSGNIEHTSLGATQIDVAVTGTGVLPCTTPLNQATSLVLTPTASSIAGSFTAAVGGADGYLVVVSTSSSLGATPNNTTLYTAGQSIGSGTVVSSAAGTSFTATGLSVTTQYYLHVYAYNNAACTGGPLYKTPALVNNATTLSSPFASFDVFDRVDNTTAGIPSSGGVDAWGEIEVGGVDEVEIYSNRLDINSYASDTSAWAYFDMSARYATNFDAATSELIWMFNMGSTRYNPSGFGQNNNYGTAVILGADGSNFDSGANGYAVILGETGSVDQLRIVRFTGGLIEGTQVSIVADGGDWDDELFSVKVTYNPTNGLWTLETYDGGTTLPFTDPAATTYTTNNTGTDQTYTATDLPYFGALWNMSCNCGEYASFDNFYIPTAQACNNTVWTGAVSTDWFTAGNWSCNQVPTASTTVTVPNVSSASGNFPLIPAYAGVTAEANEITINTGASLTINANFIGGVPVSDPSLEVYGNFTNNGAANLGLGTVILKGSSAQTISGSSNFHFLTVDNAAGVSLNSGTQKVFGALSLVNGTVTTNNRLTIASNATYTGLVDEFTSGYTGTISGNLTVERYANNTASNFFYVGAPVGGTTVSNWTGVSLATQNGATNGSQVVPTSTCSITELAAGSPYGRLFDYREDQVNTCNLEGWHVRTSGANGNAQGFAAIVNPGTIIGLNGSFVTGNVTSVNLTYTPNAAPAPGSGFNLVANPYAAPIDWVSVATANSGSISGTAYMYQTSGGLAGTYNPVNQVSGGGQIGTSQSFFVEATSNNVTMSFNNSMKRNGSNQTLRTAPVYDNKLVAVVNGNGFADRAVIAFGSNFTAGFDAQYDAHKLMSKVGQPSLYINDSGSNLSIYAQPSIEQTQIVPLYLAAGADGTFSLDFDMSEFDPTAIIYLEDLQNGTMQNLWLNNSYSFVAKAADDADRFALHFYPALQVSTTDQTCAGNDGAVAMLQLGDTEWNYSLLDANGNVVDANAQLNGTHVAANLVAGTYQMQLTHSSGYNVTRSITVAGAAMVAADFESVLTTEIGEIISFNNVSAGATTYTWDFGDGNTSTDVAPAHVYAQAGVYTVTLTASNGTCTDSYTSTLKVGDVVSSIKNITEGEIKIYSFNNILYVSFTTELSGVAEMDIYDLTGRKVSETQHLAAKGSYQLPLVDVVDGHYFVQLRTELGTNVHRVYISDKK